MRIDRGYVRRQIQRALRHHGPLTIEQLAWLLEKVGVKRETTRRVRRELANRGEVKLSSRVIRKQDGTPVNLWILAGEPQEVIR